MKVNHAASLTSGAAEFRRITVAFNSASCRTYYVNLVLTCVWLLAFNCTIDSPHE